MDMLAKLLRPAQRARLLQQADQMFWLGRDARLRSLAESDGGEGRSGGEGQQWLDTGQLEILSEAAIVNRVLDVLQGAGHDLSSIDPCELARAIQQGCLRWDLRSERDRVMYGAYCVLAGVGFDQRTEVAEALQRAAREGVPVMAAMEHFDGYDWRDTRPLSHLPAPAKAI